MADLSVHDLNQYEALPLETRQLVERVLGPYTPTGAVERLVADAWEDGYNTAIDEIDVPSHCSRGDAEYAAKRLLRRKGDDA